MMDSLAMYHWRDDRSKMEGRGARCCIACGTVPLPCLSAAVLPSLTGSRVSKRWCP